MASIRSFFKGKKQSKIETGEDIQLEKLKQLIPIRNLSEEKLYSFSQEKKTEVIPAGTTLFTAEEPIETAIYLLSGTVLLTDSNDKSIEIESSSPKAKFPLSTGNKHATTATAKTTLNILRVSQKIMSLNSTSQKSFELNIPEELSHIKSLQAFSQYYSDNELEIPSLPTVAIKLREAMKKEIGIDEAVKIIQLDPVIAAKMIEVANCPLYVAPIPVKSCFEAVKRIGLNPTRNLVISLSLKNIFKGQSELIKKQLDDLWKDCVHLSSLSHVLASISKQACPEEALLAGLVCDIGAIPFLNYISNLPEDYYDEEEIRQALPVVKGIVGASILKEWGFSEEFIQVPLNSGNWFHYTEGSMSLTDIVILSRLHRQIGKKEMTGLPPVTSIPAASKLKDIALSPENSLSILHDAQDKINEAMRTFSS